MIDWLTKRKSANLNECIEEVFFRTMLIVGLIGCTVSVAFDLLLTPELAYIVPINLVGLQILLLALYAIKNEKFHSAALFSLALLCCMIILRGFIYPEFQHATYILLITIGFMCSLVQQGTFGKILQWSILFSFVAFLFKAYKQVSIIFLARQAIPYLMVYFIITVLTGLLKERYAKNQARLTELVALLNQKNAKINEQHTKLQYSYKELSDLNNNLGVIIKQKTTRIAEKNKQLADIAYENSHVIRAPLARMLGLLHLIKIDPAHKDFYLSKLDDQASEMDMRIGMVGRFIERNLHE